MNIAKMILLLLTVGAPAFAPTVANAQTTFRFNVTDGDWNTMGNWSPPTGGPPKAADTAIIPSGKTCRVKTANQAADDVDVQSSGTLIIESKSLTVSSGASLTVNGKLGMDNTGGGSAQLLWLSGDLTIDGTGTIDGGDGVILNSGSTSGDLSIGTASAAGPTLKNNLVITPVGNLLNFGKLLVNTSSATMVLGKLSSAGTLRILRGSGGIEVTAGLMKIGHMSMAGLGGVPWTGKITVNGSTAKLNLTEFVLAHLGFPCVVLDGGGTIDLDTLWIAQGGFNLRNGTLDVAPDAAVRFERCPSCGCTP